MTPPIKPLSLRAHNAEIVDALLRDGVGVRIRLSGHSMKPLLRTGSLVDFATGSTPKVGDIALLRFANGGDDKLVAHRVKALTPDGVWTQGDASTTRDPRVPHARVLATATAIHIRDGIALPLRNPPMRMLGLLLSAVYPSLVRAYRAVVPRKKEALGCAS
jgi:hypothetical protein